MSKINLTGNWMDEYFKIAEKKGWVKEAQFSKKDMEKYWGGLSDSLKDKIIPGWDSMTYNDLVSNIELKWGAILNAYRGQEKPESEPENKKVKTPAVDPKLIGRVQTIIMKTTGIPVSDPQGPTLGVPDGVWGPRSARAWNEYVNTFSKDGPFMIDPVNPNGRELPKMDDMRFVIQHGRQGVVAEVYNELSKLANELSDMGEKRVANAVKQQQVKYKKAAEKLYDIMGETGEQLVQKVHPQGGKTLFDVENEGGKVETIIEQNEKMLNVFNKQPTGKYAEVLMKLIKKANQLEDEGNYKVAKVIDETIKEMYEAFPFVSRSFISEAINSEDLNASIKLANKQQFVDLIPVWDNIIYKMWNPLYHEIIETNPTIFNATGVESKIARDKYQKADRLKDRVVDSWHYKNNRDLAKLIKSMADVLFMGSQSFQIMDGIFTRIASAEKYARLHDKMVKSLYDLSQKIKQYSKTKQVEKDEKKQEQELSPTQKFYQKLKNDYLTELKRFENTILQNSDKIHKILNDPKNLMKWIEKRKTELNEKYVPGGEDIVKLRGLVNQLQKRLAKTASLKFADDAIPQGVVFKDEKPSVSEKSPVSKIPTRSVIKRPKNDDPEVKELQQLLLKLGHNPGKNDGKWGKNTANAWNSFVEKSPPQFNKFVQKVNASQAKHQNRPITQIKNAIKLIRYLLRQEKEKVDTIPLGPLNIPMKALVSPKVFVDYMKNILNARSFSPHTAIQYLEEMRQYVEDHKYDMELTKSQSPDRWSRQIEFLIRQFRTYRQEPNFIYPWDNKKTELVDPRQDKSTQESNKDYSVSLEKREVSRGKSDHGVRGLFYPREINTVDDLIVAINNLPSSKWLNSLENFYLRADSDYGRIGSKGMGKTRQERAQQYWKVLYNRITQIVRALSSKEKEIKSRDRDKFREMESTITQVNRELQWIGEKIGVA